MSAVMQLLVSDYVSTQLTDIIAALVSAGAVVSSLQAWVTVCSVLAVAYVMNLSGQTITHGT